MNEAGLIHLIPGKRHSPKTMGVVSRYSIGPWLRRELEALRSQPTVELDPRNGLTLFLRADKKHNYHFRPEGIDRQKPPLIDFDWTDRTNQLRDQMERINRTLAQRKFSLIPCANKSEQVPWGDFWLYRVFNCGRNDFDRHGRMYSRAGWINLPRDQQWRFLIDGYMVVHGDVNALLVRLAYAYAREAFPKHVKDPYYIGQQEETGLPRDAVKKIQSSLFFGKSPNSMTFPEPEEGENQDLFATAKISYNEAVARLISLHHPIAHLFGTNVGHELLWHESELMLDAMERCHRDGIYVVPRHDCLVIPHKEGKLKPAFMIAGDHLKAAFRDRTRIMGCESEPKIKFGRPLPKFISDTLVELKAAIPKEMLPTWLRDEVVFEWIWDGKWINNCQGPLINGKPYEPSARYESLKGLRKEVAHCLKAIYRKRRPFLVMAINAGWNVFPEGSIGEVIWQALQFERFFAVVAPFIGQRWKRNYDEYELAAKIVEPLIESVVRLTDSKGFIGLCKELEDLKAKTPIGAIVVHAPNEPAPPQAAYQYLP